MVKFKSPSVEWLPPRDKRLLDNIFQWHTHRTQLHVTHLMGAPTCGHHFVVLSPPGRTEPATRSHSTATRAYPVLPNISSESLSNSLSPCFSSKSGLPLGFSKCTKCYKQGMQKLGYFVCNELEVVGLLIWGTDYHF